MREDCPRRNRYDARRGEQRTLPNARPATLSQPFEGENGTVRLVIRRPDSMLRAVVDGNDDEAIGAVALLIER